MTNIQTKICGVTCVSDAEQAVKSGAEAIGLNFYLKSKRYIEPEVAREICELLSKMDGATAVVGVFVNASADEICAIAKRVGLTHVQLHGDESPEIVSQIKQTLPEVLVIRAVRTKVAELAEAQSEIDQWQDAGADLMLLDAAAAGVFGGSGETLDWQRVSELKFRVPWLLAGGLKPENVVEAIELARPSGVDVASGVETEPGIKCSHQVSEFVRKESFWRKIVSRT